MKEENQEDLICEPNSYADFFVDCYCVFRIIASGTINYTINFFVMFFSSANHNHMMALLQQLLHNESLSSSWRDIIVTLVCQVVQTVRPDVKNHDDDMDIRQFVHIKKVSSANAFLMLGTDDVGLLIICLLMLI